jgi:AcrR family transcriptional regulator
MSRSVSERSDLLPILGEVFRQYGFDGASLARITQATGLGKGSLYHFFPGGKTEMVQAVLSEIAAWFERQVFTHLEHQAPLEAIPAMFESVSAYFCAGGRVCLVGALALNDSRDPFAAQIATYFRRWLVAMAQCFQRGGLDGPMAEVLAQEVVGGIQGALVLSRALGEHAAFATIVARLQDHCLGALDAAR